MSSTPWRDDGNDAALQETTPSFVTVHYLGSAVQRRRRLVLLLAGIGLLAGGLLTAFAPPPFVATVTMYLGHDPQADPTRAMATDVNLLSTHSVAEKVISRLDLPLTPNQFLQSINASAATDQILDIKVSAPTSAEVMARAQTLANEYLAFRSAELRTQSDAVISGFNQQLTALQAQKQALDRQIASLTAQGGGTGTALSDAVAQRGQLSTQVAALQQSITSNQLTVASIVSGSHVLDPPALEPRGLGTRFVLSAATGLILGVFIALALIIFQAVTTERLRRRSEVAQALGVPIRVSVGKIGRSPFVRHRSRRELVVLRDALAPLAEPSARHPPRIALVCVDSVDVGRRLVRSLVSEISDPHGRLLLVDLTSKGMGRGVLDRPGVDVYRPESTPLLCRGPGSVGALGSRTTDVPRPVVDAWTSAHAVLTLVEMDLRTGIEHLGTWADTAVVLAVAGRSTYDRLRSSALLLRASGVPVDFAIMSGDDSTDETLGDPALLGDEPVEGSAPNEGRSVTR